MFNRKKHTRVAERPKTPEKPKKIVPDMLHPENEAILTARTVSIRGLFDQMFSPTADGQFYELEHRIPSIHRLIVNELFDLSPGSIDPRLYRGEPFCVDDPSVAGGPLINLYS